MELEAIRHGWIDPKYLSEAARSFGIVPKIKSFAGTQFDALAISDNIELEVFLRSLTSGLKAAYWIEAEATNTPKAIDGGATALVTIRVYAGKVSKLWAAAEALASALKDDGIEALPEEMPIPENSNANTIHILIGPKGR